MASGKDAAKNLDSAPRWRDIAAGNETSDASNGVVSPEKVSSIQEFRKKAEVRSLR